MHSKLLSDPVAAAFFFDPGEAGLEIGNTAKHVGLDTVVALFNLNNARHPSSAVGERSPLTILPQNYLLENGIELIEPSVHLPLERTLYVIDQFNQAALHRASVCFGLADPLFYGDDPLFYGDDPLFYDAEALFYDADPLFYGADPLFYGAEALFYLADALFYGGDPRRQPVFHGAQPVFHPAEAGFQIAFQLFVHLHYKPNMFQLCSAVSSLKTRIISRCASTTPGSRCIAS